LAHYLDPSDVSDDEEPSTVAGAAVGVNSLGPRQTWREGIAMWPCMDIVDSVLHAEISSTFGTSSEEEEEE
jgi:hypothetical protein